MGKMKNHGNLGMKLFFMRDRMDKATEEHQLNFSVIATPAEGLSGSL